MPPLYDWACTKPDCNHVTETLQAHDDPPPKCEKCGGETKKKPAAQAKQTQWSDWSRGY